MDLNAQMLSKQAATCEPADPVVKRAESIRHSTGRMTALINDLLDISKIEAGHLTLEPKEETLDPIVHDVLMTVQALAEAKALQIDEKVSCKNLKVVCDRERVAQVFSNILSNAIKFTPTGGKVTIECDNRDGFVVIAISDTGPGIPHNELPYVFDRFWQAKRAKKAGAGLGLSIAKAIVQAHGGDVSVVSQPGVGTTFYFTLPTEWQKAA
jgi:signal transduction histidine kinase